MWIPAIVLLLTAYFLFYTLRISNAPSLYWPGWYLLQIPLEADETALVEELHSAGVEEIIASTTAELSYMAIPEMRSTTVNRIEEKLFSEDPRYDYFLRNVKKLFRLNSAALIFLPNTHSIAEYRKIFKKSPLFKDTVLLDDRSPNYTAQFWLFILPACCFLLFFLPGQPLALFSLVLAWVPFVLLTGNPLFALALCLFTPLHHSAVRWPFALAGSLLVLGAALWILPWQNSVICILACIGSEGLYISLHNKKQETLPLLRIIWDKFHSYDHQLFEPIRLIEEPKKLINTATLLNTVKIVATLSLLLPPFLAPPQETPTHEPVPAAQEPTGHYSSPSAWHTLANGKKANSLPDASDFLSSRIYQENFLNAGKFNLPIPNEQIYQTEYFLSTNKVETKKRPLVVFDNLWFTKIEENILSQGIGRLFASLSGPSPIISTKEPLYGDKETVLPIFWEILIAFITLFCAIIPRYLPLEKWAIRRKERRKRALTLKKAEAA